MIPIIIHYTLTHPFLFENGDFFSSLALTAYTYPVNTVNENVSFQNRSQERRFLETPFCCARLPAAVREISPRSRKRSFLKTITSRSQIPRNAHSPIKDGTVFKHHEIAFSLGWGKMLMKKLQRIDADLFRSAIKSSVFKQIGYVWTATESVVDYSV